MNERIDQAALSSLIAERRYSVFAQGQRLHNSQYQTMFYQPRNNPARMQISEGYTFPMQVFASSNTWDTPQAQTAVGNPAHQPSTKLASPFHMPIPTRMPWDL